MKRGTPDHPKVFDLCERLKCDRPTAVGLLEMLWHFTAKYAPQGDIGRYPDRRIEAAMDWGQGRWKQHGKLIRALSESHWIDISAHHRLVIHDWHDHADESVRLRLKRAGLSFVGVTRNLSGQSSDSVADSVATKTPLPLPVPEPEPEPEPHTQPEPSIRRPNGVCVSPRAADQVTQHSSRFEDAWTRWPLRVERDAAARAWLSVVTLDNEEQVFACIARYLDSDQVARGVVNKFAGWLYQQSRDCWAADWPTRVEHAPRNRTTEMLDEAERMMAREEAAGYEQ